MSQPSHDDASGPGSSSGGPAGRAAGQASRPVSGAAEEDELPPLTNELLSVVCHDLRSPLSSIVMGADFLRKALAKQDGFGPEKRILESMMRSASRLTSLISDLHDVAHIGSGHFDIEAKPLDVRALLTAAAEKLGALGVPRGVAVDVGAPAIATVLVLDGERVLQAIGELVENAIRYSPANGTVRVRFEVILDRAVFSVADDGEGMGPDRLAHAFDHAWHASQSPRDGTGLGLALVRGIAKAHGGDASVETEQGHGTRVLFWLPLAGSTASGLPQPASGA